jgi:hypothetical protein
MIGCGYSNERKHELSVCIAIGARCAWLTYINVQKIMQITRIKGTERKEKKEQFVM